MPQVILAPAAVRDLQRLRDFLNQKNPDAARRAAEAIRRAIRLIADQPLLGRLIDDLPPEFREWIIEFGDSGYVLRYRLGDERITILTIRHQKEAG